MKVIFFTIILFLSVLANGQISEPKFGKIETADLSLSKYDKDTTADALMLFNNGTTEFVLTSEQKFQFLYTRHCQIKLFKKSAFPIADFNIRLYKSGSSREELRNLKAVTYNLTDGKIVKTKLENDN